MSAETGAARAASLSGTSVDYFESQVFAVGGDGVADYRYRIPSLAVTASGTLLAFCEARHGDHGDHAENDIVLKRSFDGGRTWGPLSKIADDGERSLNNVVSVVERQTGRVIILFQSYPKGLHHSAKPEIGRGAVEPGLEGDRICRTYQMASDDDGATWSTPRDVTRFVKRPTGTTATLSGPGIGIQLRCAPYQDRIVVPFYQYPAPTRVYAVYSDDLGETWRYGSFADDPPEGAGNECQIVELRDGRLMLNARRAGSGPACRKVAFSADGGATWSPLQDAPPLVSSGCQGSILRYTSPLDGDPSRILFCNPASPRDRRNGTIRLSYDEGATWPVSRLVNTYDYPGYRGRHNFCYSCLAVLPDMRIGCLYESVKVEYTTLMFSSFTLGWLTAGRDTDPHNAP